MTQLPFSPAGKCAIELGGEAASKLGHDVIGTEHLLLGLLKEGKGIAAQVLTNLGLRLDEVRDMVLEVLVAQAALDEPPSRPPFPEGFYRHVVERPSIRGPILEALQQGRSVCLVGPPYVGKTSLVMALAREKTSGFHVRRIDYRIFDEFDEGSLSEAASRDVVRFVPEGEFLTVSRTDYVGYLAQRRKEGERLILEFREGGCEGLAARCPELAKELVPINVGPPGEVESVQLLKAACLQFKGVTGLGVSEADLAETDLLARQRLSEAVPPWGAVLALWEAEPIERELRIPEEVRRLNEEIVHLEREKDIGISLQEFERAAVARDKAMELKRRRDKLNTEARLPCSPDLSIESIRLAIEKLVKG